MTTQTYEQRGAAIGPFLAVKRTNFCRFVATEAALSPKGAEWLAKLAKFDIPTMFSFIDAYLIPNEGDLLAYAKTLMGESGIEANMDVLEKSARYFKCFIDARRSAQ